MKATNYKYLACLASLLIPASLPGVTVTLDDLQVRTNATFGNAFAAGVANADIVATTVASGVSTSESTTVVWSNVDVDGIGGTDDQITFTLTGTSNTTNNITWGGLGWGASGSFGGTDSLTYTVSGVSVTAGSASTGTLIFEGFTGGGVIGYGSNIAIDTTVEINGVSANVSLADNGPAGGFQFDTTLVDFGLASSATFDNSTITSGAVQARSLDLQFDFTPIPEPSSALLLGVGALGLLVRRRK